MQSGSSETIHKNPGVVETKRPIAYRCRKREADRCYRMGFVRDGDENPERRSPTSADLFVSQS